MKSKIFLICMILLIICNFSCKVKQSKVDIPQTESDLVWENGIITEEIFTDKGGREHQDIKDFYFLTKNSEDFINIPKCTGINEPISDYSYWFVKARVKNYDGLWDTDDPNVQSRVGPYLIFDTIIKIDYPERITFSDGNANTYKISNSTITFTPVTKEESSSGIYSGGVARIVSISQEQFADIFIIAESMISDKNNTTDKRLKGTGNLNIEFTNSKRNAIIKEGASLDSFIDILDTLLNNQ
ncbi:MAG TPA: hypothetical protein PLL66_09565 [Bacteroidales bacterium]|nr:hypothetical protein [Bacteroidales bacterium]